MTPITADDLVMTPAKAAAFYEALNVVRNVVDAYTLGADRPEGAYEDRDAILVAFYRATEGAARWLHSDALNLWGQND